MRWQRYAIEQFGNTIAVVFVAGAEQRVHRADRQRVRALQGGLPRQLDAAGGAGVAGTVYRQAIESPTGDTVVVQVMEPTLIEPGRSYPLVLQEAMSAGVPSSAAGKNRSFALV